MVWQNLRAKSRFKGEGKKWRAASLKQQRENAQRKTKDSISILNPSKTPEESRPRNGWQGATLDGTMWHDSVLRF